MSPVPHTSRRPLALLTALALALALLVSAASAPVASAAYPPGVKKGFMKTCVPGAKNASGGALGRKAATRYCSVTFTCLKNRLTFKEFLNLAGGAQGKPKRVMQTCQKKGLRAI